ncbi:MAG: hypothetical protein ACPGXY_04990 [Alphaproteobacteria bacterium]
MKHFLTPIIIIAAVHCASAIDINQSVQISRELCDRIMVDHIPDGSVAYQPDTGVVPADLGGSIQITPPTQIRIPVQIDLERYLAISRRDTTKNHHQLSATQGALDHNNTNLNTFNRTLEKAVTTIRQENDKIAEKVKHSGTSASTIHQSINAVNEKATQAISTLNNMVPVLNRSENSYKDSLKRLEKQFTPYERDPIVIDRNETFRKSHLQRLSAQSSELNKTSTQISALKSELQRHAALRHDSPHKITDTLPHGQVESFETSVSTAEQSFTAFSGTTADFQKKFDTLNLKKTSFVEDAFLGNIEAHLDGRLYYNGQPLFQQDQWQIKEACRRVYLATRK